MWHTLSYLKEVYDSSDVVEGLLHILDAIAKADLGPQALGEP